ncbi:hypothetical protein [Hymenobacter swuensis]|uniref:Uncharacterized protein n=1 Tax=Hymenobacter swuensis DY53 TaxID=1227739 RepID=W8EW76_9BACT|nr:hypothetical protein [Hymenobacter swuensis]AHJ96808.1 hypothetical protein Hsw_1213 [Hymenobacter swuensis DY53]
MKYVLLTSAFALLLLGTSCSSEDKMLERPSRYGSVSMDRTKRENNKARFRKERKPIGLGLNVDPNAKNPYKYRTVDAPKKYKYAKPR